MATEKNPTITAIKVEEEPKVETTVTDETVRAYLPVKIKDYKPIREQLARSAKHGLTPEEAIATPAMLYKLRELDLTTICFPADRDPYKTTTLNRIPCLDKECAGYGGSLRLTNTNDYKCSRRGNVYPKEQVLKPCPICGELMLKRGTPEAPGLNDYCPAGDCVFPGTAEE